jgi:hypothetical protein
VFLDPAAVCAPLTLRTELQKIPTGSADYPQSIHIATDGPLGS